MTTGASANAEELQAQQGLQKISAQQLSAAGDPKTADFLVPC